MKNKIIVAVMAVPMTLLALAGAASAQTPTAVEAAFTEAEGQITSVATLGLGLVVAALLLGIGATLVLKWVRRGVKAT